MASTVKIKRSNVAGKVPTTSDITAGELALNTNDGRLYSTDGIKVTEIGANVHSLSVGTGTFSIANGSITFPTSDGGTNQVLQTNGSGTLSFATVSGGISNVVEDTTPQLGGNLDVNGNKIVSVSNGDIDIEPNGGGNVLLGNFTFDADQTVGSSQDNYILTYDHSLGEIRLEAAPGLVNDTNPALSGNLNTTGFKIVTSSNANIDLEPNGTGNVLLGNFTFDADQTVGLSQDNYVLTYDHSAGHISLEAAAGGGINSVVEDTTPQLGGNLDAQSYNITSLGTLNTHTIPSGTDTLVGRLTTDTLQNKTLTDPKIPGYIADSNGNELIKFTTTAGAKNEITITNAAAGGDPTIAATGSDTNIDLQLSPKGGGNVLLGNFNFDVDQTVGLSQDNYVLTYDDGTGYISLEAAPGLVNDTNPALSGNLNTTGFKIVTSSNANIDLEPNGTGNVLLGNYTFDADQAVGSGQDNYVLTYDDSAGHISLEAAAGGGGGGGGWEYVSTVTASNSSTIDFFGVFSSGYDYKITGQEIRGQYSNTYYHARVEVNSAGNRFTGGGYALANIRHISNSVYGRTATSTQFDLSDGIPLGVSNPTQHHNIDFEIINPADQASYYAPMRCLCWGRRSNNTHFGQYFHGFLDYKAGVPITGISFYFNTGYTSKGRFKLYRRANV